jgi:uncharacterized protein YgiM (DUF1202 family)
LLTPDATAAGLLGLVGLAGAAGCGALLSKAGRRRRWRALAIAAALPAVLFAVSLGIKIYTDKAFQHAVVLAQKVYVRSGPGDDNASIFEIHEGLKVEVHHRRGGWAQISLPNGFNGWIPEASFELI